MRRPSPLDSSERHPPPSEPEEKLGNSKLSWENEDEWEKKFVSHKSKSKEPAGLSEELPEIDSEEIVSAKGRSHKAEEESDKEIFDLAPAGRSRGSSRGESGGLGSAASESSRLGGGGLGSSGFNGGSGSSGFGGGSGSSG
ncbi:unnamed protein product, partial [Cylicostephanus goldi]